MAAVPDRTLHPGHRHQRPRSNRRYGNIGGQTHAFLLTPEPSTWAMFATALDFSLFSYAAPSKPARNHTAEIDHERCQLESSATLGVVSAGREVAQALTLLSRSGFKLYMLLCLEADLQTGRGVIATAAILKSWRKTLFRLKRVLASCTSKGYANDGEIG